MDTLRHSIALVIVGFCISFEVGCGDKADPEDLSGEAPGGSLSASTLAGADDVLRAVEGADYKRVISSLAKMKRRAKGEDQVQFMILSREVKDMLLQLAGTDREANQALRALRMLGSGR